MFYHVPYEFRSVVPPPEYSHDDFTFSLCGICQNVFAFVTIESLNSSK